MEFSSNVRIAFAKLNSSLALCARKISWRVCGERGDVNAKCDQAGASPLHYAVLNQKNGSEIIDFLVESFGLKVNVKDDNGEEPIHYAIRVKNIPVANKLLVRYFHNEEERKNNLFHFCLISNKLDLAKIVLESEQGLISESGELGLHVVHFAAWYADLDTFRWLQGKDVDVNELCDQYQASALHYAAYNKAHGDALIRYLVADLGLDVNARGAHGLTPLHYALYYENIGNAELLLSLGADLGVRQNDSADENIVQYCARNQKPESVKYLFKKRREFIEAVDSSGLTTFQFVVQFADVELVEWILSEFNNDVPGLLNGLHYATYNKTHGKNLVDFFVSKLGFNVNAKEQIHRWAPIHYALFAENIEVVDELIKLGADLKVELNASNLLHFCVAKNKVKSAKHLLVNKILPVNEQNLNGKTAVHLAAEHASVEMIKLLTKG